MVTSLANREVAAFLTQLAQPHALVSVEARWQPRGFLEGDEARLGEAAAFLTPHQREALSAWWLAVRERANTPNWDIVSTCQVEGRPGLVLVEAKAHDGEMHRDGKDPGNSENDKRISAAVAEANNALGGLQAGWGLCTNNNYQLCNRFAWAWKIASLGIPVILVYLGFLDADEMGNGAFRTPDVWRSCLLEHAQGVVPAAAWEQRQSVDGSWFVPVIRAARVSATVVETSPA